MNPHPIIFPKLINLYNKGRDHYYFFLEEYLINEWEGAEILRLIRAWIIDTNYPEKIIDK